MLYVRGMATAMLVASLSGGPLFAQTPIPGVAGSATGIAQRTSAAVPGIFGCAAPGSKQVIGAGGGGVVGGLIGYRIAGGNRMLGTVIGGAVGAAAGSWIGCRLQIGDQRRAQAAVARAAADGRAQHWSSADTGVSGSAVPLASSQLANLSFPGNVVTNDRYDSRAGIFRRRQPHKSPCVAGHRLHFGRRAQSGRTGHRCGRGGKFTVVTGLRKRSCARLRV